jgi:alpha-glucoside transport system substrate-binding protein
MLTRQFPDAVRDVFEHRAAAMVVAPDFAEPIVREGLRRSGRHPEDIVGIAPFPPAGPERDGPRIGGGDVIVVTESAGSHADRLVEALAAPEAPLPWIDDHGGFLAPNHRTQATYSALLAPVARESDSWSGFDLSDQLGAVGGRNGLWRILTDFLIDVGDGATERINAAVDRAVAALGGFERGRR